MPAYSVLMSIRTTKPSLLKIQKPTLFLESPIKLLILTSSTAFTPETFIPVVTAQDCDCLFVGAITLSIAGGDDGAGAFDCKIEISATRHQGVAFDVCPRSK